MMSKWKKVRSMLGLKPRTVVPRMVEDTDREEQSADTARNSGSMLSGTNSDTRSIWRSRNSASKKTCMICIGTMRIRDGHAIFTAECGHSFHFHCITSNVNHGNKSCPICRAKWKEIPARSPSVLHRSLSVLVPRPLRQAPEPMFYDDDEQLEDLARSVGQTLANDSVPAVEINLYPEFSAVPKSKSYDEFTVLVNLKAACGDGCNGSRAPVDLVTVLDISGSMSWPKMDLLKQAMMFLIQNLRSNDRLSIVAFSASARRILPLLRMTESGREKAVKAVNSLSAGGGTDIAKGLYKMASVFNDRRGKNVISSAILLSDGRDTCDVNVESFRDLLVVPVHTFGFGSDHDASLMHSISRLSGGTFSFIENEAVIQHAFARCIGGLLSVALHALRVEVSSARPLRYMKTGSYRNVVSGSAGFIDVGDVYTDEERNFLVALPLPSGGAGSLVKVACVFNHPVTSELIRIDGHEASVRRIDALGEEGVSMEVDRQRIRVRASEAMEQARAAAEHGDFARSCIILEECQLALSESLSGKARDQLCKFLNEELKEMQERMADRCTYEASGRAFVLSGLSSHSSQRATSRGNTTDVSQAYQTRSMTQMITWSQTLASEGR